MTLNETMGFITGGMWLMAAASWGMRYGYFVGIAAGGLAAAAGYMVGFMMMPLFDGLADRARASRSPVRRIMYAIGAGLACLLMIGVFLFPAALFLKERKDVRARKIQKAVEVSMEVTVTPPAARSRVDTALRW